MNERVLYLTILCMVVFSITFGMRMSEHERYAPDRWYRDAYNSDGVYVIR